MSFFALVDNSFSALKAQIQVLESALEPQIVHRDVAYDQDAVYFGDGQALVATFKRGKLLAFVLVDLPSSADHDLACRQFLLGRYANGGPVEIFINRLTDPTATAVAISQANGRRVRIKIPKRGPLRALLHLCQVNYDYRLSQSR